VPPGYGGTKVIKQFADLGARGNQLPVPESPSGTAKQVLDKAKRHTDLPITKA